MYIRVTDNSINRKFSQNLQSSLRRNLQASQQADDGQRIRRPSDDPAAISRTLKNLSAKRALTGFKESNIIALRVAQSSHDILDKFQQNVSMRAQNIAAESSSLIDDEGMSLRATEVNVLIEEAVNLANKKLTGTQDYLFGGDKTNADPFDVTRDTNGDITSISYQGASTAKSFYVGDGVKISPQLSPQDSAKLADYINNLIAMRDALRSGDSAAIPSLQQALISDHSEMLGSLTELGAMQKRLLLAQDSDSKRFHEIEMQISMDLDADLATLVTEFQSSKHALDQTVQIGTAILNQPLLNVI